jgi:sugar lactone lactonase YvrE
LSSAEIVWQINIPEALDLAFIEANDIAIDPNGNIFVSDIANSGVYKFDSSPQPVGIFQVDFSDQDDMRMPPSIAVAPDSTFSIADPKNEGVTMYNEDGKYAGEYGVPGVVCLCQGPNYSTLAMTSIDGCEHINIYDEFGSLVEIIPAPSRHRGMIDPAFVNMDCDSQGNMYVSYGMPPYRIWKIAPRGMNTHTWTREFDYPEDAVLISDIAVDPGTGVVWALLACRNYGRQMIDAFSPDGDFLGTVYIPQADKLFGLISADSNSNLYLVDTGTGPGASDLLKLAVSF